MSLPNILADATVDASWAALAALGFAMLFNVPKRTLTSCVICGAVGHSIRAVLIDHFGMKIVPATLVGATVVGFVGMYFAHRLNAPALIFTVSGIIPMVPGVFAYQTMLGLLRLVIVPAQETNAVLVETSVNAVRTILILGALAAGIIAPDLLFRRNKPVV